MKTIDRWHTGEYDFGLRGHFRGGPKHSGLFLGQAFRGFWVDIKDR
jgi:hypothetical protein